MQVSNLNVFSEEWVIQKILILNPDFEEQGIDDPNTILRPLASYMRPMLINCLKEKRKVLFTENAEKTKRLLDNLQKKVDESVLNMQLYERALDLFEDDQSTSVILHRHLLRTTAATIVDTLFLNLDMHTKLKNGIEVKELQNSESFSLSSTERTALAKSFPGPLSKRSLSVIESLEGRVSIFFLLILQICQGCNRDWVDDPTNQRRLFVRKRI